MVLRELTSSTCTVVDGPARYSDRLRMGLNREPCATITAPMPLDAAVCLLKE